MGLTARLLGAEDSGPTRGPLDDFWFRPTGTVSQTGLYVTPEKAMEVSAVFACVKVIAETLAMLPLVLYRRVDDVSKERAVEESLYWLLHNRPNQWQTAFEFKETMSAWGALHGNAYAEKIIGHDGDVVELLPIHPLLVSVERLETRRLRYQVLQPDGQKRPLLQDEVLHVRGLSLDGMQGVAFSVQAKESIALARAMEAFGSRYFANDTTVGLVLEHPGTLKKEAQDRLRDSFQVANGGVLNAFKPKILEEGMKLNRLQASGKEAQLIEGRLHQVVEICRFFRMPPHKIAHLIQATFSNIEHQAIEFVTDTIGPWATRWEQAVTRDLIVDDREYVAKFTMNALLRGDAAARSTYYKERFNLGSLSPNEIRELEDENPIAGGDRYYVNAATVPLDEAGVPMTPPPAAPPAGATAPSAATTTAAPDSAKAGDDTADASAAARLAFRVLITDVADRIARAEVRQMATRAEKAREDYPRWSAWACEALDASAEYVARALMPVATAWTMTGGVPIDVAQVAAEVVGLTKAHITGPGRAYRTIAEQLAGTYHESAIQGRAAEVSALITTRLQLEG